MQNDLSIVNSIMKGHSLKTKNGKLYICLLLSGSFNDRVQIESKAHTQFNIQINVLFKMKNFSSSSFRYTHTPLTHPIL